MKKRDVIINEDLELDDILALGIMLVRYFG